jgi:hypothetical protein
MSPTHKFAGRIGGVIDQQGHGQLTGNPDYKEGAL